MRTFVLSLALALCFTVPGAFAGSGAAAQTADGLTDLVGTWTVTDPATGQQDQLIITPDSLQFGAGEPPVPYTAERSGDSFALFVGGPDNPATLRLLGRDRAELTVPGGVAPLALARVPDPTDEAGAQAGAEQAGAEQAGTGQGGAGQEGLSPQEPGVGDGSLIDELTRAAVPYGVTTRYEPLNESLEALLAAGWKLDQAAGASGAFTLLLTNGASNVLCILVPQNLGQAATALSDCRRLN